MSKMKFKDGAYIVKSGVKASSARILGDTKKSGDSLTIYATVNGSTKPRLSGLLFEVELTAPADDIIGVKITHFKGDAQNGPFYALNREKADVSIEETEDFVVYRSGKLEAKVKKATASSNQMILGDGSVRFMSSWDMSFFGDGKYLTGSEEDSITYYQDERGVAEGSDFGTVRGKAYVEQQLSLDVGECLYGLGERFGALVKNGQTVDMWMADGATKTDNAYKNVPFYLSNKGYGVFVDSPSEVSFDLASGQVERAGFHVEGESLQYYFIYGKTPKDVLERYTFLTGRPALPPAWSFGLWLSTSFTTNYDEKTVTSFIDGMKARDIPLSVFHFDCFWMRGDHWTDFEWDPDTFPEPRQMLARYKAKGLKICVWINSYIAQLSALFDEAAQKGYLLKKTNGGVWQTDQWQSGMGIVDFTNPDACKWYQSKLEELMDMGVDCFKTDFGERIPVRDVVWFDGSDPLRMHNYYTHLYNKVVFEAVEKHNGKGNAVVFARSGTAGTQQYPVHWGGDSASTYPSMAGTLRAGLSLACSGYSFWSHDISGFYTTAAPDLYKRWLAFGMFSSHSRLHGASSYRVPWNFDEESSEVARFFGNLKNSLMPYIYRQAIQSHKKGTPILRPMVIDFPDDMVAAHLDKQYMFGDSLLVAPLFNNRGEVTFYVPEGKWTGLLNGKIYEGGRTYTETHDYFSLPVLVRENTLLAIGADKTRPDYAYERDLTLRVCCLAEGAAAKAEIPDVEGNIVATVTAEKRVGRVTFRASRKLEGLKIEMDGKTYDMPDVELTI